MGCGKPLLVVENGLLLVGLLWAWKKGLRMPVLVPGVVQARHPDDLNKGIPTSYDGARVPEGPRAFEWWYFDARFTDGHTFVGGIMDPDAFGNNMDQSQTMIHINKPDGTAIDVRPNRPRSEFSASKDSCDVRLGPSTMRGSYPTYHVDLDAAGIKADLEFTSLLPGWTSGDGQILFGSMNKPAVFGWVVAQPRAKVSGTIAYDGREFSVEGEGYHDHNWGNFVPPARLSRWHWGRIVTPEITMVFADVVTNRLYGGVHIPLLMIARGDRLALETFRMEWVYADYALDSAGLQSYPRTVEFRFGERDVSGRLRFRQREELEINNLFEQMGVPGRVREPLARFVAQPAYYRLLSEYEGEIDFAGEVVPMAGETIMEYMMFDHRRGAVPRQTGYPHFLTQKY